MSKLGIVGVGAVRCACALSCVNHGSAHEIVLLDRARKARRGGRDRPALRHALTPKFAVVDGDYADLTGCALVMITLGIN